MISSNNGEVRLSGYGFEVLADFHCIVAYLKETMSDVMGDEKAKVILTKNFLDALSSNLFSDEKEDLSQQMLIDIFKDWR